MRWPRRGILIRLCIYVPLIAILGWRARGGCSQEATMEPESVAEDPFARHRRVIKLPDGTQQEILELTPAEAEAMLGHPIPDHVADEGKDEAKAKAEPPAANEPAAEPPAAEAPPADDSP